MNALLTDPSLFESVNCLTGVIAEINETRRESEILHHVVEVENSLKYLPADLKLVSPGRLFLREAQMEKVGSKNQVFDFSFSFSFSLSLSLFFQRRHTPVMLWMFNDCLVWAKIKMRTLEFSGKENKTKKKII